jgi:hypothetical protein
MLIFDDIYTWRGWGGKLKLGSGKCRLRIHDLKQDDRKSLTHLRPIIVIVSDIPEGTLSVRSCCGHIATLVTKEFNIDPARMLFVEYYPAQTYGDHDQHLIPERYDAVEFKWHADKAIQPRWRPLNPPMLDIIKSVDQG